MKRILTILLCVCSHWAFASNTLSLSASSGHPGDTLTVSVSLTNSDAVTALQADIPLGENLHYVSNSTILNSSRSNGHAIVAAATDDTLHVTIFSLAKNALNGSVGELLTFKVELGIEPATYTLTAEPIVTGTNSQALECSVNAGSLTILSPKIQVITTSLDYGHIPIRSTYNRTLQVKNTGNEPLHISDVLFSAVEFSTEQTEYTIAAGQTQNITLSYAPVLHGAISETVRLRSNAINDPDVYGANVCQLIADPFSVNELRIQSAAGISDDTVTIRVRMNNMESIVGIQFSLKMPAALDYLANSAAPLERAPGHSVLSTMSNDTLTLLLYHPSNAAVTGDDGDLLSFRVRLNGTSGSYTLQPINTMLINAEHANMVSAVYNANVTIQSPTISANASLPFEHISVDESHSAIYAISNTGQAPLTVERVTFLSEGLRVITSLPIEIAQNTTQNIEVEFTPWQEGAFSTIMQVYSNDPACRMKSVNVTADVYEPNIFAFRGELSPTDSTYHLFVELSNYSDIAGLQFDINGLTPWTSYGLTSRAPNHQIVVQPIDESYRVIVFAMNNSTLTDHEGAIIEWTWTTPLVGAMDGQTISMDNIVLVHPSKGNREFTPAEPLLVDLESISTDIENVNANANAVKILRDGQIFILRGDKTYTVTGQEAK